MVNRFRSTIWNRLFSQTCVLCGATVGVGLCDSCKLDFPVIESGCSMCGIPLAVQSAICGQCLRKPRHFERAFCAFHYEEPVSWMIQQLKFGSRLVHIKVLSQLLSEYLRQHVDKWPDVIMPVPLHRSRLYGRGFNQALELARPIAREFDIPISVGLCRRSTNTVNQSGLPAKQRAANVRNAFELKAALPAKNIAILDDVVTTGSTTNEIARLLKRNGAKHIQVWALARSLGGRPPEKVVCQNA